MSNRLRTWTRIDRMIGPVYRALHFAMLPVTRIRKTNSDHVLIIKIFGLGSIVRLLGLCEEAGVDLSRVTIVTSSAHKELCRLWGINAIFIESDSTPRLTLGCWRVLRAVRRIRPTLIVDFERCSNLVGIFRTTMAFVAGCRAISFEQREKKSDKATIHNVDALSQDEIFLQGIRRIPVGKKHVASSHVAVDVDKVLININASDLLESRRYPAVAFAGVVRAIYQKRPETRFYLSGVRHERSYVQQLVDMLPGLPVYNVSGEWNLQQLLIELAGSALLITGDSGPLHLGMYMKVPTVSIWGPTQAEHFGYRSSPMFVAVSTRPPCSPCFRHPHSNAEAACNGGITCMKQLDPNVVATEALAMLSKATSTREVFLPTNMQLQQQPANAFR